MYTYATVRDFQDQASTADSETLTATQTARVLRYLRRVTSRIEEYTGFRFVPEINTYYIRYADVVNRRMYTELELGSDPLLAVSSIVAGSATVSASNYRLFPYTKTPAFYIEAINSYRWSNDLSSSDDRIAITGTYGYRTRYDRDGWVSSTDSVQDIGGINSSVTTITVTDADGVDENLETPRFTQGQVIRINDEFMTVLDTNTTTNVLTVKRGALGSTAAAHDNADAIDIFSVEPEIVRATMLIASYNLENRGKFSRVQINNAAGFDTTNVTLEIPDEAKELLNRYAYRIVRSV